MFLSSSLDLTSRIQDYKEANQTLLDAHPEFRRWLDDGYVPIAGGWQY